MSSEQVSKDHRAWWWINVTGYGGFAYFGTAGEARQMMRDKAAWEGGRGSLRAASDLEATQERKLLQWKKDHEYPLDEREMEAIG